MLDIVGRRHELYDSSLGTALCVIEAVSRRLPRLKRPDPNTDRTLSRLCPKLAIQIRPPEQQWKRIAFVERLFENRRPDRTEFC